MSNLTNTLRKLSLILTIFFIWKLKCYSSWVFLLKSIYNISCGRISRALSQECLVARKTCVPEARGSQSREDCRPLSSERRALIWSWTSAGPATVISMSRSPTLLLLLACVQLDHTTITTLFLDLKMWPPTWSDLDAFSFFNFTLGFALKNTYTRQKGH